MQVWAVIPGLKPSGCEGEALRSGRFFQGLGWAEDEGGEDGLTGALRVSEELHGGCDGLGALCPVRGHLTPVKLHGRGGNVFEQPCGSGGFRASVHCAGGGGGLFGPRLKIPFHGLHAFPGRGGTVRSGLDDSGRARGRNR